MSDKIDGALLVASKTTNMIQLLEITTKPKLQVLTAEWSRATATEKHQEVSKLSVNVQCWFSFFNPKARYRLVSGHCLKIDGIGGIYAE